MHTIGEMAREAGVKITTIRSFERNGLMPEPGRTWGGQRRYDQDALDRLRFICHARALGFDLPMIRDLLSLSASSATPCASENALAAHHLADVRDRIARLQRLEAALSALVARPTGHTPDVVLRTLATPLSDEADD
jgi:DNA-binding transcriptional MerR regulator